MQQIRPNGDAARSWRMSWGGERKGEGRGERIEEEGCKQTVREIDRAEVGRQGSGSTYSSLTHR